jgi:hypothetical protein
MSPRAKIVLPPFVDRHLTWLLKPVVWLYVKKLEYELWSSRRFQQYCRRINCLNLVELEDRCQRQIQKDIVQLRMMGKGSQWPHPWQKEKSDDRP